MNIIQNQAEDFAKFEYREREGHTKFLEQVQEQISQYKKIAYKVEFIQYLINSGKIAYDKHLLVCTEKTSGKCGKNKFYENTLFFLQEELEDLESQLPIKDFSRPERALSSEGLDKILSDLNELKMGQRITYDDLYSELEELKDFYFLGKKNWIQLFAGKMTEMVAGGIISETVSKGILQVIQSNYDQVAGR